MQVGNSTVKAVMQQITSIPKYTTAELLLLTKFVTLM